MAELLHADGRHVRVSTLLQVADLEVLTGRLVSSAGLEVVFFRGEVVQARLGGLTGILAVHEGFLIPHGRLSLEARDEAAADPITSVLALIVEGCRLADDWSRLAPMALAVRGDLPAALSADTVQIVAALDGRRPVRALVESHGIARCRIVDPLLRLIESRILVEEGRTEMAGDDVFDQTLALARAAVRSGRYEQARSVFEQALTMRPGDSTVQQNLRRIDQLMGDRFA